MIILRSGSETQWEGLEAEERMTAVLKSTHSQPLCFQSQSNTNFKRGEDAYSINFWGNLSPLFLRTSQVSRDNLR